MPAAGTVFSGGRAVVLLGRRDVDLRLANLPPRAAILRLVAICGTITVRVPIGWPLQVSGQPAFGAVQAHTQNAEIPIPGGPALRVVCSGLAGRVEITN